MDERLTELNARCELVAGELLLFHGRDWAAERLVEQIKESQFEHVSYGGELAERLSELDLTSDIGGRLHLVLVPEGQEQWKMDFLHWHYRYNLFDEFDHRRDPDPETVPWDRMFMIAPNHMLTAADEARGPGVEIQLSGDHADYARIVGLSDGAVLGHRTPRIMVLDTGVAPEARHRVVRERNFVGGPSEAFTAADDHGHGSVVSSIITDLLPNAELIVYKVANRRGRVSEWDFLCALAASADADVINMSLVFGLQDRRCPQCGIESGSSRSKIFEHFLNEVGQRAPPPLVVAAAGNRGISSLFYPARFGSVIAVSSVTSALALSSFSNYGNADHVGDLHPHRFVLPGGGTADDGGERHEHVARRISDGFRFDGTSFAAAYASAVIGALRSQSDTWELPNDALIDHLKRTVQKRTWMSDSERYGNGVMRFVAVGPGPGTLRW